MTDVFRQPYLISIIEMFFSLSLATQLVKSSNPSKQTTSYFYSLSLRNDIAHTTIMMISDHIRSL